MAGFRRTRILLNYKEADRLLIGEHKNGRNNYVICSNIIQSAATNLSQDPNSMDTNHYRRINSRVISLLIMVISILVTHIATAAGDESLFPNRNKIDEVPSECESCKLVVQSFQKGLDRTSGGKHEGGDTSWEERNLKSYADSEVRLVEIQEDLCNDVTQGKVQCFALAEDAENHIEEWWFNYRRDNVRLHDYLCINKLKKCCPDDAYGPTCQPCPKCNHHGSCEGFGTRVGSGECICQSGYTGKQCEECEPDFYKVQTLNAQSPDQSQFSCLACHQACIGGCSGPSSVNCTDCKPGYRRDPITSQCMDINECELNSHGLTVGARRLCPDGTYCQNTEGHYKCANCHRACSTCLGFGRNKCITCAADHFLDEEHNCVYTRDASRHDPNLRVDENFLAYIWRRFQTDIVLKIMMNILLYPIVRWIVEKINYGSTTTRKVITFLATINIQMELYPFVQKMIITNFGKNLPEFGDDEAEENRLGYADEFATRYDEL